MASLRLSSLFGSTGEREGYALAQVHRAQTNPYRAHAHASPGACSLIRPLPRTCASITSRVHSHIGRNVASTLPRQNGKYEVRTD